MINIDLLINLAITVFGNVSTYSESVGFKGSRIQVELRFLF